MTGASGFVGRYLANHLATDGIRIIRFSRRGAPGHVPVDHAFDSIEQQAAMLRNVEVVFHLAARAHRHSNAASKTLHTRDNLEATKRLFEASVRAEVPKFVFVSTIRVLGETSVRPFVVTDPPRPSDAYSESKARAEEWLEQQQGRGVAIVIVRPPLVYGPGVGANFLRLMNAVGRGWPLPLAGATAPRSQIARTNLVDLLALCGRGSVSGFSVLHCRDDQDFSVRALIGVLAELMNRRARLFNVPARILGAVGAIAGMENVATRLFTAAQCDDSATRIAFGWHPRVASRDALNETVAWWRTL